MDEKHHEPMREFYLSRNTAFIGEVTGETVEQLIVDLATLASDPKEHIDLVISDPGSDTLSAFRLTEFIEHELGKPVHAITWGGCHSSCSFILLSCRKRVARPLTTFVIHRQTSSVQLQYDGSFEDKLEAWKTEQAKLLERIIIFYEKRLRINRKEVEQLLERGSNNIDCEITVEEALKIGLITEISKS